MSQQNSQRVDATHLLHEMLRTVVTTAQAAELLGYSTKSGSINRLINEGALRAETSPNGTLLVYLDSIEHYRESRLRTRSGKGRPRANPEK